MARTIPPKRLAPSPTQQISRRTRPPAHATGKAQGTPRTAPVGKKAGTPRQSNVVLTEFTKHFHNWGGHLPFVEPEDCPHPRRFADQQPDGIVHWIDNGICRGGFCPNGNARCDRYWEYWKKGGKDAHQEFMEGKYPSPIHKKKED